MTVSVQILPELKLIMMVKTHKLEVPLHTPDYHLVSFGTKAEIITFEKGHS